MVGLRLHPRPTARILCWHRAALTDWAWSPRRCACRWTAAGASALDCAVRETQVTRLSPPRRCCDNRTVPRAADPRMSFDLAAEIYDEIRPSYPAALFDYLFDLLPPRPNILEVAPGTCQATRDLLRRGAVVHAIEIGPAMAARLR